MTLTSTTTLPADRSAPRLARRWVNEQLNPLGLDPRTHETVTLLTSELVTNAVLHTASMPTLTLVVEPTAITVGVQDSGGGDAELLAAEPDRVGGTR